MMYERISQAETLTHYNITEIARKTGVSEDKLWDEYNKAKAFGGVICLDDLTNVIKEKE